jgi:hypothetical protein
MFALAYVYIYLFAKFNCKMSKRQQPIDSFFNRTIKLKSGETVRCQPSEVQETLTFLCPHPGCSQRCLNRGALATHVSFAHPSAPSEQSSKIIKFTAPSTVSGSRVLMFASMIYHAVSYSASIICPRILPASEQQVANVKVDGRTNNKGESVRRSYSSLLKAKLCEQFEEEKLWNPALIQEDFAFKQKINQSTLSAWLANKEKIFQQAADEHKKTAF